MLSYQAIGAEQDMHAEPGRTSDRLSGTRAATTFKKLPMASPGARASAAKAGFIPGPIGYQATQVEREIRTAIRTWNGRR